VHVLVERAGDRHTRWAAAAFAYAIAHRRRHGGNAALKGLLIDSKLEYEDPLF
jgi:hypothetical protein